MQPGRSLQVLVADDDPIQLRIAARLLRELGHAGALAPNGRIALELLDQRRFDLLLLDLSMPVLDGMATLAALRQRRAQGAGVPPVWLVSGNDLEADWAHYRQAGASGYLVKPLQRDTLQQALRQV